MGRPEEVAALIKQGKSPQQIRDELDRTTSTVQGYLWRAVGEKLIMFSDIAFAIPLPVRERIESLLERVPRLHRN